MEKQVKKNSKTKEIILSTGDTVYLTRQDERLLKNSYLYLSGFYKRQQIIAIVDQKREEVTRLAALIPSPTSPGHSTNKSASSKLSVTNTPALKDYRVDLRSAAQVRLDEYQRAKDELTLLEDKLQLFLAQDHKVGAKDIDAVLRHLGHPLGKRTIEVSFVSHWPLRGRQASF